MARELNTRQYLDSVCELLHHGEQSVPIPVAGSSMVPFLIHGDTVYLDLPELPIRRGDVVLYTRSSGRYVLHRVYRVNGDGSCIMAGDAQTELEHLPSQDQIHARVTMVRHKGKLQRPGSLRWWFYRHIWLRLLPHRQKLMRLRGKLRLKK